MVERFHPRLAVACSFQKEASVVLDLLLRIAPDARVFTLDTHVLFPETYETWKRVEERYGISVEVHQGPSLGRQAATARRPAVGARPGRVLRPAQGRAAPARRSPTSTPGSPGVRREQSALRAGTPSSPGTPSTSAGRPTRWPTGPRRTSGATSPITTPVQPAARPRLRLDRLHPLHHARAPAATGAGRARARPSAACTADRPRVACAGCCVLTELDADRIGRPPDGATSSSGSTSRSRPDDDLDALRRGARPAPDGDRGHARVRPAAEGRRLRRPRPARLLHRARVQRRRRASCSRSRSTSTSPARCDLTVHREPCRCSTRLHHELEPADPHEEDYLVYQILDGLTDAFYPRRSSARGAHRRARGRRARRGRGASSCAESTACKQEVHELQRLHRRPARPVPDRLGARSSSSPGSPAARASTCATSATTSTQIAGELHRQNDDLTALTATYFNANAEPPEPGPPRGSPWWPRFFVVWTLVTGFFGQNFGWLVDNIESRTRLPASSASAGSSSRP